MQVSYGCIRKCFYTKVDAISEWLQQKWTDNKWHNKLKIEYQAAVCNVWHQIQYATGITESQQNLQVIWNTQ